MNGFGFLYVMVVLAVGGVAMIWAARNRIPVSRLRDRPVDAVVEDRRTGVDRRSTPRPGTPGRRASELAAFHDSHCSDPVCVAHREAIAELESRESVTV